MSKRVVYLGSNNNHFKEELKEQALAYLRINKGDGFYYLLPNRELLNSYRNAFIDELDAAFDLNFITFDDIVNKIMESSAIKMANNPIKRIIMRKILRGLKDQSLLEYYKDFTDYHGFIESCIYIVGNIKRSLLTPEEYLLKCGNLPYFKEIGMIYYEYEKILKEKAYLDKESLYIESIKNLKEDRNFGDHLHFIIIDEFFDFRPIELEIIKLLIDLDIDIYINVPFKIKADSFRLSETIEALKNLDFEIKEISKDTFNEFEELGNIMFDKNELKVNANVELIKANSLYLEVKKILNEIKNNFHHRSIDLNDNCICVFNDKYLHTLFKVAEEEKIPLSIDNAVSIKNLPLTREIINLIETNIYFGEKDRFLNRIKSSYLQVCHRESRDILEYILRKAKFKDVKDLYHKINYASFMDIPEKYREEIIAVMDYLREEQSVFPGLHSLEEFNDILLRLLEKYEIEKGIIDRYETNDNFQLLKRDLSNLKLVVDILHNMDAALFNQEKIDLEEYLMILKDYFDEENIIQTNGNSNGVHIITLENARGFQYKNVFITGLTQGTYPDLLNSNFFYSDDNYSVLKKMGIDVKDYKNRLDNEILKFASLISSCKEKLYLSCNLSSEGEEQHLYSIFLDEILNKLCGEQEKDKVKVTTVDLEFLYSNEIAMITSEKQFTLNIFNDYFKGNIGLSQLKYHNSLFADKLENIGLQFESEMYRSFKDYNHYSGLISDDVVKDYISESFKNRTFSVSFLEDYLICPYAFLLKNIFNIEPLEREVDDYDPLVNGIISHEVLRIYFENYKDEFNNIDKFNCTDTLDFLKKVLLRESKKHGYSLDSNDKLLLIEDMYNKLKKYIEFDIERLKKYSHMKPWKFEEGFNITLEIDQNRINIRGIIDRIDRSNDDKYIIIDYKSSTYGKKSLKDIENKMSLQLPIYIIAQKDKKVIGGFYGIINNPEFFNCMGLINETSLVNKRQGGAVDLPVWNQILADIRITIGDLIKQMLEGDFSVDPRYCSPYCNYKDVCRYDHVQEVE